MNLLPRRLWISQVARLFISLSLFSTSFVFAQQAGDLLEQNLIDILKIQSQADVYIQRLTSALGAEDAEMREQLLEKRAEALMLYVDQFNPGPRERERRVREALNSYVEAARSALKRGRRILHYSDSISDLAFEANDKNTLIEVFEEFLEAQGDSDDRYLVLVHYAKGLAKFQDNTAEGFFEEAMSMRTPEDSMEAHMRYSNYLKDIGELDRALQVLERYSPEQRVRFWHIAMLRQQLIHALGFDSTEVDEEVARIRESLSGKPGIGDIPKFRGRAL